MGFDAGAFQAGKIETRVGANLAPLDSSLNKAVGSARAYAGKIGSAFAGLGKSIVSPFVGVAAAVGGVLAVRNVVGSISEAMESIDNSAKAADRLGMTTQAFVALNHQADLAGVQQEELTQSLTRMQGALVDAANGAGSALPKLQQLGLDARELVNLSPEQAFGKIGDSLNSITNPAERASAAMEIFGAKAGPKLLGMLSEGSQGVKNAAADADLLGLSLTRVDAAKVELANDALSRVKKVVTGLVQKIAVELSPYVKALADKFVGAATAGGGFGQKISGAVEGIIGYVAFLSDRLSFAVGGVKLFAAVFTLAGAGAIKAIDLIGAGLTKLINLIPGVSVEWTQGFSNMADAMFTTAGRLANEADQAFQDGFAGKNSAAVKEFFANAKRQSQVAAEEIADNAEKMRGAMQGVGEAALKQQQDVATALAGMRKEVEQLGLSDEQKKLADFSAMAGVSPEQIAEFKQLTQRLGQAKEAEQIDKKVEQWREGLKGPKEKFEDTLKELGQWLEEGRISQDEWLAGVNKAQGDVTNHKLEDREPRLPELVRAGSAEMVRMQFAAQQQRQGEDYGKQQVGHLATLIDLQKVVSRKLDFQEVNI